jgi:hypothetical protein
MAYIGVSPSNGVRKKHTYTATASQTSFSGAGDEGITLAYRDSNYVDVYQNGVKLADEDYTATSGTAIVLAQGASADDIVEIIAFDVFSVADTVSKADGGTFDGNVTMAGTLGVTGVLTTTAATVFNGGFASNAPSTISDGTSFSAGITVENTGNTHGSVIDFLNNSDSPADNDYIGGLIFKETNSAGGTHKFAGIFGIALDITDGTEDGALTFETSAGGANTIEHMRITSDGVVLVGQTSFAYGSVGCSMTSSGQLGGTANGDTSLVLNRTSSDGTIAQFRRDNTVVGTIGGSSTKLHIASGGNSGIRFRDDLNCFTPCNADGSNSDNDQNIGQASVRYDTIFATNSTINTSDRNEKQDIEELSDAEKRVAVVAKGLMRKYRWKSAVAEKGDNARTHFGIIAQDLQDAFTAESLDASDYAMFCSDTWWEKEISVDAVEAVDEVTETTTDEDDNDVVTVITEAVEAKDAYTYMDTKDEATDGYTEKTRLGVRYSELLAFIISAI